MSEQMDDFDVEVSALATTSDPADSDERDAASAPDDAEIAAPDVPPTSLALGVLRPCTAVVLR